MFMQLQVRWHAGGCRRRSGCGVRVPRPWVLRRAGMGSFLLSSPPFLFQDWRAEYHKMAQNDPLIGDDIVSSRSWTLLRTHTSVPELQRCKHHSCGTGFSFLSLFYNDNFFQLRISLFYGLRPQCRTFWGSICIGSNTYCVGAPLLQFSPVSKPPLRKIGWMTLPDSGQKLKGIAKYFRKADFTPNSISIELRSAIDQWKTFLAHSRHS